MVAFNAIKPGDTLYDCRRQKMGNTSMSTMATWRVIVHEVDPVKRIAFCSWNGNAPKWWTERWLSSLRRTPVKTRKSVTGAEVRTK